MEDAEPRRRRAPFVEAGAEGSSGDWAKGAEARLALAAEELALSAGPYHPPADGLAGTTPARRPSKPCDGGDTPAGAVIGSKDMARGETEGGTMLDVERLVLSVCLVMPESA
jgi:hypothetical protein